MTITGAEAVRRASGRHDERLRVARAVEDRVATAAESARRAVRPRAVPRCASGATRAIVAERVVSAGRAADPRRELLDVVVGLAALGELGADLLGRRA